MARVGIEALNAFGGSVFIVVAELADYLDMGRFENLLMREKAVPLFCEDPITCAVNAAAPIIDTLSETEKNSIELLTTCSESGGISANP